MFFFKGRKKNDKQDEELKTTKKTAAGYTITNAVATSTEKAAELFTKPENYTGNRYLYDSGSAKANIKQNVFNEATKNNTKVIDDATGAELILRRNDARQKFGENWQEHLAESDHVIPIEKIHEKTKKNPWLTNDDIKDIANSDDNLQVVSRKFNNAKRSRTNEEFVNDEKYLEKTNTHLTNEGKDKAIEKSKKAQISINKKITKKTAKNIIKTGHKAGFAAMKSAAGCTAVMSGTMNIVAVLKGEKTAEEALVDVARDSGKAVATGYVFGAGLTTVAHSLSNSSSKFIQGLIKSNIPGHVITAVMVTGNTLKRYANGDISTQECILELGEKGLNVITTGYSMAVGQALIPIPVVGAAVGALVGSALVSSFYNDIINTLTQKQIEHEERMRLLDEYEYIANKAKEYKNELKIYLDEYFQDYKDCFDDALSEIKLSFQSGDTDGVIKGANMITKKLGGDIKYNNVDEFKIFISSNKTDIL